MWYVILIVIFFIILFGCSLLYYIRRRTTSSTQTGGRIDLPDDEEEKDEFDEIIVKGGDNIVSKYIKRSRETIDNEKDVKLDFISLAFPPKLLADISQKVILKYVGGMRNMYGLKLFGNLQCSTEIECKIDEADDEKIKGTQTYIMDKILLIRLHSKLMKLISESSTITDIFIKGYFLVQIEYYKTIYNPIAALEMAELAFESLKDISAADCTDVYRFLIKLGILTAINFYKHKRPACIEWFKSITDKEIFAFERALSINNPKLPGGIEVEGLWSMIDCGILLKEFIPYLLETVSDEDIKFVVDIIMMKPNSAKQLVKDTANPSLVIRGVNYAIAAAQLARFTVDMLQPKKLIELEDESTYDSFVNSIDKLIATGININERQQTDFDFSEHIRDVATVVKDKSYLVKDAFDKLGNNVKDLGNDAWEASKEFGNAAYTASKNKIVEEANMLKQNPKAYFKYTIDRVKYYKDLAIYKSKTAKQDAINAINQKYNEIENEVSNAKTYAEYKAISAKNAFVNSISKEGLTEALNKTLETSKVVGNEMLDIGKETFELTKSVGTKLANDSKGRIYELFGDVVAQYEDGKVIIRDSKGDVIRILKRARKHLDTTTSEYKEVGQIALDVGQMAIGDDSVLENDMSEEELMELVNLSMKTGEDVPGFVEEATEKVTNTPV